MGPEVECKTWGMLDSSCSVGSKGTRRENTAPLIEPMGPPSRKRSMFLDREMTAACAQKQS